MGFGFDSLWMMSDGHLVRVNAADNTTVSIDIPVSEAGAALSENDKYRGIAVGEGAVWVPDTGGSTIYKVDPNSNKVMLKIPTDIFGGQGSIGVGADAIWVVTFDNHDKTLTRYNAKNGAEEAKIALPKPCRGVTFGNGYVWVTAASSGELYRINPLTNRIASTTMLHGASHILAAGEGSIWIAYDAEGLVERIDAKTADIAATIKTGSSDMESDGDIAVGGGFIWVITRGSIVARIDPTSNQARGLFQPESGLIVGRRIRFGGGSLWISGKSIFRIRPPE
jgi:virginiamycin B lyase